MVFLPRMYDKFFNRIKYKNSLLIFKYYNIIYKYYNLHYNLQTNLHIIGIFLYIFIVQCINNIFQAHIWMLKDKIQETFRHHGD